MEDELLDYLKTVLDDPSKTIKDILLFSGFQYAFQKEYPPLVDYFKKDENIIELTKYCFNPNMVKIPDFNKLSQASIQILTSTLPSFFQIFVNSHALAKILHDFLMNDAETHPMHCGFLYRVISQQVRWGNPIIFTDYLDIGILLLKSIQNLAIQDLIVAISTNNTITIFQEMNMILLLSEIMISQMDESAASTLIQIYDNISDDSPLMAQYSIFHVVQNMIDFSIASKSIAIPIDLVNISIQIIERNHELLPIIIKKKNFFEIRKNNISYFSVLTIPLFNINTLQLFSFYFEPNACKCLHDHLAVAILSLKTEEIISIAEIPNFIDSIIKAYKLGKRCCHMIQLIIIFGPILLTLKSDFIKQSWIDFFSTDGVNIRNILEQPYGGEVPSKNDTLDDAFDEIVNFEEEEEEFEEDL